MSKKQLHQLAVPARCIIGIALPVILMLPPNPGLAEGVSSLLLAALALSMAQFLRQAAPFPARFAGLLLFPLLIPAVLALQTLPYPINVWMRIFPLALVAVHLDSARLGIRRPLFLLCTFISLALLTSLLMHDALKLPPRPPPRMPVHLAYWLVIAFIVPLGLASRELVRPFARRLFRVEWVLLYAIVGIYPFVWTVATSFKLPGEPDIAGFHELKPLPRFFVFPTLGKEELSPSELRKEENPEALLRILNELQHRLTPGALSKAVPESTGLSPDQFLRAMRLYGYMLEDRYGFFIPSESFTRSPPPEMNPSALPLFKEVLNEAVTTPEELAGLLELDESEVRQLLGVLRRKNLVNRIPGTERRYRLTPQARRPFESGLFPRQYLLLRQEGEVDLLEYQDTWSLSPLEARWEMTRLVRHERAEAKTVWNWGPQRSFLRAPGIAFGPWLWRGVLCGVLWILFWKIPPDTGIWPFRVPFLADAVLVARFGELAFSPDLDLVHRAVAVSLCLLPAVPLLLTGSLYRTDSGRD